MAAAGADCGDSFEKLTSVGRLPAQYALSWLLCKSSVAPDRLAAARAPQFRRPLADAAVRGAVAASAQLVARSEMQSVMVRRA